MNRQALRRLRNAVLRREREVEVDPDGQVREIPAEDQETERRSRRRKPTKLAPRTFGGR